jgi:uncharacterized protein YkwD
MKKTLLTSLVAVTILCSTKSVYAASPANSAIPLSTAETSEKSVKTPVSTQITVLTNIAVRKAAGKKALKESTSLDAFALMRASDMAENHYFSHYRGNNLQLDELGLIYPDFYYGSSGENLFRVRFKKSQDQLAESCVSAWAASQVHYVNMTDVRWKTMGAAAVSSDDGYTYAVQIFSSQDAK